MLKNLSLSTLLVAVSLSTLGFGIQSAHALGECGPGYKADYVRMKSGIYRNNWRRNNFIELKSWSDVPRLYGVPVKHAQGRTCGCTVTSGNPPRHRNSICQRALNAGLR